MKPEAVAQIHRQICARENCEYLDQLDYTDPCVVCPNGHWGQYESTGCSDQPMGLGDAIASVATPIARVLGLPCIDPDTQQLLPESNCNKRRQKLNEMFPFQNQNQNPI